MRFTPRRVLAAFAAVATATMLVAVTDQATAATPAVEQVAGVHVIQQVDGSSIPSFQESQIRDALEAPGVVAFGIRVSWTQIDTSFALLDEAKAITDSTGDELTVRFMAGRRIPARIQNACPMLGSGTSRYARPFDSSGTLNTCFLDEYRSLVDRLATWARANDVHELHLSHYAKEWAEFYWGPEVQAIAGQGTTGQGYMVNATNALVDIGAAVAGPDLLVELPMSGHGPLMRGCETCTPGIAERVAQHVVDVAPDSFIVQGNGWDEDGVWGATSSTEVLYDHVLDAGGLFGVQMIQPYNTFDWPRVFDVATAKHATTAEVYLPSFSGGTSAQLRAEAATWEPYVPDSEPPPSTTTTTVASTTTTTTAPTTTTTVAPTTTTTVAPTTTTTAPPTLEQRVADLEARVAALEAAA